MRIEKDSKFEALIKALEAIEETEPHRKVIIFTYFKPTLAYLARRLKEAGYRCTMISGDVVSDPIDPAKDKRGQCLREFRDNPDVRVLLSTQVGGEGLDFQFCHIVVNYDLPWNPMLVEQRIGRLDRYGQQSDRIIIVNLAVNGTIEQRILDRLYTRIRIFEESIGDLEPIIGSEMRQLASALLTSRLTPAEMDKMIEVAGLRLSSVARRLNASKRSVRSSSVTTSSSIKKWRECSDCTSTCLLRR